ncbi:hypothetical protein M422DRAFT_62896 [Sphaerobolus stellatus SS14]|nr:hypothetical protein M422DRAFT_62896 [Sphaerobolus stellatus SS14]
MKSILSIVTALSCCLWAVQAIPTWDMVNSRQALLGSFVPGSTVIYGYGSEGANGPPKFLRTAAKAPGVESNATLTGWRDRTRGPPSRFFVNRGGLYQMTNQTHILYGDLLNVTSEISTRDPEGLGPKSAFKLQLLEKLPSKNIGGTWEWSATMLNYRLGNKGNNGLFYQCQETNGDVSVIVPLDPARTPPGCEVLILVSHMMHGK